MAADLELSIILSQALRRTQYSKNLLLQLKSPTAVHLILSKLLRLINLMYLYLGLVSPNFYLPNHFPTFFQSYPLHLSHNSCLSLYIHQWCHGKFNTAGTLKFRVTWGFRASSPENFGILCSRLCILRVSGSNFLIPKINR